MPFSRLYGYFRRRTGAKTNRLRRSVKNSRRSSSVKRFKGFKRKAFSRKGTKKGVSRLFKRRKVSQVSGRFEANGTSVGRRGARNGGQSIGLGGRWFRKRVMQLDRRIRGKGSGSPRDHYIITTPTALGSCDPGQRVEFWYNLWGTGAHIANMLTNIRTESPFTLGGGANLYQPTLLVSGWAELEILPAGVSPLHYEVAAGTPFNTTAATIAQTITGYAAAWTASYDAQPSDYSFWPSTSVLENTPFWLGHNTANGATNLKPSHYFKGKAEIGQARKFVFRFKTRRFRYDEYTNSTFLTDGAARGKSYRLVISMWGEPGQVCGVKSAVNQPMIAELGTQVILRHRAHYFYKWVAGNNRPTVYGSQYATNESVDDEALGWVGVPALRAQRGGAYRLDAQDVAPYTDFGALYFERKHEAVINPVADCAGDLFTPTVDTTP